jgi:potassium/chloride transporter 9
MVDINIVPILIMLGVFAATFFSSMSNLLGASRVLNRVAHDKLFGLLLQPATVETKSGEFRFYYKVDF